jgi:hypothetical protein
MREVNWTYDVIEILSQKMGFNPESDLLKEMAFAYIGFLNTAVKKVHDRFDVPDWTLIEQRTPDANHYIPWEQVGQPVIHRMLKLYLLDPRVTSAPVDYPFHLDAAGVWCGLGHGTTVWIRYMRPAPQYSGDPWINNRTYGLGQTAYGLTTNPLTEAGVDGHTYASLQAGNLNHALPAPPSSSNAYWQRVPFPESVADIVIELAFADALREDGQFDKGQSVENTAINAGFAKFGAMITAPFDILSDQPRAAQRYQIPIPKNVVAGGK